MGSNLQLTNGSEEDEWQPIKVSGKQIDGKKIHAVSGGGQEDVSLHGQFFFHLHLQR